MAQVRPTSLCVNHWFTVPSCLWDSVLCDTFHVHLQLWTEAAGTWLGSETAVPYTGIPGSSAPLQLWTPAFHPRRPWGAVLMAQRIGLPPAKWELFLAPALASAQP